MSTAAKRKTNAASANPTHWGDPSVTAPPVYYIRRLQQIAVALFLEETDAHGITPVQYAALEAVRLQPGIDQRTLALAIGFDTSTIGGVVDRLEARDWLQRSLDAQDRRVRRLSLTAAGEQLLNEIAPAVARTQQRILAPLPKAERAAFVRMLHQLTTGNEAAARAPRAPQSKETSKGKGQRLLSKS